MLGKKNLFSRETKFLSDLQIDKNLSQWKSFDLSPTTHEKNIPLWQKLNGKKPNTARKLIQAQTLHYIATQKKKLQVTPAELRKAPSLSEDFPDANHAFGDKPAATIEIQAIDCLYAAQSLVKAGHKVAVLNMANQFHKGGGYKKGAGAQEEDLFRRTNLSASLPTSFYSNNKSQPKEERGFGEFNTLYSETVTVFRNGVDKNYCFYKPKEQFPISVISSAAYNLSYSTVKKNSQHYIDGTIRKILMQLETAIEHGHEYLVLSAFGCGAFGNDPKTIAKIYREILNLPRYRTAFKKVIFAIIPNPGATNDNFTPFKEAFSPPAFWQRQRTNIAGVLTIASITLIASFSFAVPAAIAIGVSILCMASFVASKYFLFDKPNSHSSKDLKVSKRSNVIGDSDLLQQSVELNKHFLPMHARNNSLKLILPLAEFKNMQVLPSLQCLRTKP